MNDSTKTVTMRMGASSDRAVTTQAVVADVTAADPSGLLVPAPAQPDRLPCRTRRIEKCRTAPLQEPARGRRTARTPPTQGDPMSSRQHGHLQLQVVIEKRPLIEPFHITGYTFTEFDALIVSVREGSHVGRGEAEGIYYHGDTAASMLQQVQALHDRLEQGVTREKLLDWLPAGGARNAIDCALWDLEAKQSGQPVWRLAGSNPPRALMTTFTVGADEPATMANHARAFRTALALKLKLTDDDLNAERVFAVRAARPDAWIMVDANQGFTRESFKQLLPALQQTRIALIEQPFPAGREDWLDGLNSPIPLAADESVQDHRDLQNLTDRVSTINIKLDKCGGLTEALSMAKQATVMGFDLMVGNMSGSSLAMAPAFVLGQQCKVVDLDGPLYLREDCTPSVQYEHGNIWCPDEVWGAPLAAMT
ncbi:MAG: dipeptide epimerase [Rhodanobacteraceae bacterium]